MKLEPFLMERMQSTWENIVDYNLSESGVHPISLGQLLEFSPQVRENLMEVELGYCQSNGTIGLRDQIAALYPGATREHVMVTTGTSEANFLSVWNLVDDPDEVVIMLPNYMQIWGIGRGFRGTLRPFHLREENGWKPDFDDLKNAITSRTRLIAVCNPNNPTGAILSENEMNRIIELAGNANAWLLADEVYQGAERKDSPTPTFWGKYEKTIITNGLSKAYGIPGIRIGWAIAPSDFIAKIWSHHDYTTIGPGMLSDLLARVALEPSTRQKILMRTKSILQANYPILAHWIAEHGNLFSLIEPKAGAIAYLHYKLDINSTKLAEKLLREKSVLIVPGDHFGMDHYLRIGYGPPKEYLQTALDRIHETLKGL